MIICVDFDGTVVTHDFPRIGKDIGAAPILKKLVAAGHQLVLFTMRSDDKIVKSSDPTVFGTPGMYLTSAVEWFKENEIPLYGINTNPNQKSWTSSPKCFCNLYIDDAGFGAPLKIDLSLSNRPFIDWKLAEQMLIEMCYL